ncbi:MAG: hypothetical protein AAGA54_36190 [Myxococcota bacterium]
MTFRIATLALLLVSTLAGCEEPETMDMDTELRAADPETSEVGIIAPDPFSAAIKCQSVCEEIGCSDPAFYPTSEIEWLEKDKWLCTCECIAWNDPCEFINTGCINPELIDSLPPSSTT